jgi:tetratricopeptide (TPR) repeat protein
LWLNRNFEETVILLDQAITLKPEASDPYFWKGMAYASLMQDEMAMAAIERSLDLLSSAKTSKYMLVS